MDSEVARHSTAEREARREGMTMSGKTVRLTVAQALVRFLTKQMTVIDGEKLPIVAGCWAIFGHGNVAGIGEALYQARDSFPTWRAHNEQGMALAATAYAKAMFRRRFMACTTSIGPGALNMVTAAAVAHVDRLPLLLLPGDVFANRLPDPVLQQIEDFSDGTVSANDCFRPVSRYFDRINRPEQLIPALQRAMSVLTDPAECGPVTLAMCQDVQTEAYDWPESLFAEKVWTPRRIRPDVDELAAAVAAIKAAKRPMIIAGGGVLYSEASAELTRLRRDARDSGRRQPGRQVVDRRDPPARPRRDRRHRNFGGQRARRRRRSRCSRSERACRTSPPARGRCSSRTTCKILALNVAPYDTAKHRRRSPWSADARVGLTELSEALRGWKADPAVAERAAKEKAIWLDAAGRGARLDQRRTALGRPGDRRGRCARSAPRTPSSSTPPAACRANCTSSGFRPTPGGYHMEYGFSCMGYEIAGGMGVKMARPDKEVVVMVGDGSYMMLNSEIATSVSLGVKLVIVVLDNHGFGCINRLQMETGGANFNNLWEDCAMVAQPDIDFARARREHGRNRGQGRRRSAISSPRSRRPRPTTSTTVVVIETHPLIVTEAGGHWWDVAVPEVSPRREVAEAREKYETARRHQRVFN